MDMISIGLAAVSISIDLFKEISKKILLLFERPHYFLVGSIISSVLANKNNFPFREHLFFAKSYLALNWVPFIIDLGSFMIVPAGILLLIIWLLMVLIGILSEINSGYDDNLILILLRKMMVLDEDNPISYVFIKGFEAYLYCSMFFSNILILCTLNLQSFSDLISSNKSLYFSVGFGNTLSIIILFIVCSNRVKTYFGFRDR